MLGFRLEGDPDEAADLLRKLQAAGVEVLMGTVKRRGGGVAHTYGTLRMPGYVPPEPLVRATVVTGRPAIEPTRRRR